MMKKYFFCLMILLVFTFCKSSKFAKQEINYSSLKIDTLLYDKINIRAITIANNKIYYAGDKNRVGYINIDKSQKFVRTMTNDTLKFDFRSIAATRDNIFIVNAGNPAYMYKLSTNLIEKKIVYNEINENVFYDSMQFWNDDEGIAFSDPTDGCLSIIITRDKGKTWKKIDCETLPKFENGEAGFAASNSIISIVGNKTWIATGGTKARIFFSPDKGVSWKVYNTPITQGQAMTGIFTSDFYNEKIGFIAGGNYEKPNQNYQNKAITNDGGKTWKLVNDKAAFGYTSCVKFFPYSNGNKIVSVGHNGIWYSNNKGATWRNLSEDNSLFTLQFLDKNTAITAGKNKIIKITFQE